MAKFFRVPPKGFKPTAKGRARRESGAVAIATTIVEKRHEIDQCPDERRRIVAHMKLDQVEGEFKETMRDWYGTFDATRAYAILAGGIQAAQRDFDKMRLQVSILNARDDWERWGYEEKLRTIYKHEEYAARVREVTKHK